MQTCDLALQLGQRHPAGALELDDPIGPHELLEVVDLRRRARQHHRDLVAADVDDAALEHLHQLDDLAAGRAFDIHPAGMLALDVARIEAGLLLIEVDFNSSKKALIDEQKYSPFELGLGRLVHLEKNRFVGQATLLAEKKKGSPREIVGLEIDWPEVESLYENVGLPPAVAAIASRVAVPVFKDGVQVGKATSSTWSPTLKKMIALATVKREYTKPGTQLQFEITIEAKRHRAQATVVKTPFFNPKRKTATPVV